ncbi:c-type cytochrome [Hyalangium versicolor]|uniref:c-type cytochrome n=1 Tax=Hyalangium versicolor TaxID=2861190 RepID=UPI001CCA1AD1|nr:c-type cytochrome [Hyalangium versicolor]
MTFRVLSRLGSFALVAVLCLGHSDDGGCGGSDEQEEEHEHEHGGTATGATCPTSNAPTAQNFGTAFLQDYCLSCHSASATGVARQGAPLAVNFDTLDEVRTQIERIDTHAAAGPGATNTEMPPANRPQPTQQERATLGQWLACGAP